MLGRNSVSANMFSERKELEIRVERELKRRLVPDLCPDVGENHYTRRVENHEGVVGEQK